jgi:DNA invertase Pin-like site-specific DNA recombinase
MEDSWKEVVRSKHDKRVVSEMEDDDEYITDDTTAYLFVTKDQEQTAKKYCHDRRIHKTRFTRNDGKYSTLSNLLSLIRSAYLVVNAMSDLGRNAQEVQRSLRQINQKGITLHVMTNDDA